MTEPDDGSPPEPPKGPCARRGPVELRAALPEKRSEVANRFQQQNGSEWRVDLEPLGMYVRGATRAVDANAVGPAAVVSADQAKEMALDFVRKNADLFGLSAPELAALSVRPNPGPPGTLLQWDVELSGKVPRAGYERFASVGKNVRLFVSIQRDGVLRVVSNPSEYLPPFELCTSPLLGPEDSKVRAAVLGKELGYADVGGGPQSAGKVDEADIRSASLTILVDRKEGFITLYLAYELRVQKAGLSWSFFVDADTGKLIAEKQGFAT
jgi:hypothetical protein